MINPFVIKKWGAFLLDGFLPTIGFFIGLKYYGFGVAMACFGGAMLISMIIANILINHPFRLMVEGKGVMCINIDSTGLIKPFILKISQPYIRGKIGKQNVTDIFDRNTVFNLDSPTKVKEPMIIQENGDIDIKITNKEFNQGRFGLFHYPVVIWNNQIKSVITKDFLSFKEREAFAEHGILYIKTKVEDLSSSLKNFARYVVDQTRPQERWFENRWVQIAIVVVIIILAAMFLPSIINAISGVTSGDGVSNLASTLTSGVTPR